MFLPSPGDPLIVLIMRRDRRGCPRSRRSARCWKTSRQGPRVRRHAGPRRPARHRRVDRRRRTSAPTDRRVLHRHGEPAAPRPCTPPATSACRCRTWRTTARARQASGLSPNSAASSTHGPDVPAERPADIARNLAEERAYYQPELEPELKAFLGNSYENLLSTDVYARWARDQRRDGPGHRPPRARTPGPRPARPNPRPPPWPRPPSMPTTGKRRNTWTALDPMTTCAAAGSSRGGATTETRRMLAETAAMPAAGHPARGSRRARRRPVAPDRRGDRHPGRRARRCCACSPRGRRSARPREALEVSKWTARTYLERLRVDGAAQSPARAAVPAGYLPVGGDGL